MNILYFLRTWAKSFLKVDSLGETKISMEISTTLVLKRKYPSFTLQQKTTANHFLKEFLCVHDSLRCSESPTYMYKNFCDVMK